jgi:hypothetical protein
LVSFWMPTSWLELVQSVIAAIVDDHHLLDRAGASSGLHVGRRGHAGLLHPVQIKFQ